MSDQQPSSELAPPAIPVVDPFSDPAQFEGLLWRRSLAYVVDLCVLLCLLLLYKVALVFFTVITFGLATPLLVLLAAAIPVAYHTLTIGGPGSATLGMRLFGLQVRIWNGGKPGYIQALLHTAVFYVTTSFTGGLILLWPLFSNRRRCLHDQLCGTMVVRRLGRA
ncbi:RDD family protein [Ferrovibrio sp.]|uniref:RDD family protein n=1 Tax=Ferrovibrio sp. TaxID=1917215 RepID=UPI0025C243A8|nr:RDD family protein [Ferrovibrio sp.]